MSRWQIMRNGEPTADPLWDDQGAADAGEAGFTTSPIAAHVAALGPGYSYNYVGESEPPPPAPPA